MEYTISTIAEGLPVGVSPLKCPRPYFIASITRSPLSRQKDSKGFNALPLSPPSPVPDKTLPQRRGAFEATACIYLCDCTAGYD